MVVDYGFKYRADCSCAGCETVRARRQNVRDLEAGKWNKGVIFNYLPEDPHPEGRLKIPRWIKYNVFYADPTNPWYTRGRTAAVVAWHIIFPKKETP
jgi:hypothetical protein